MDFSKLPETMGKPAASVRHTVRGGFWVGWIFDV